MKNLKNNLLATGILIAILIVVLVSFDIYQKNKQKEGIVANDLLKAPKEKIVDYKIKPTENSENIIIYRYVSNKEVPAETYQGLNEDITKRTPNSLTFLKSVKSIDENKQQEEYVAKFYTDKTFQKEGNKWYRVETATTTPSAFFSQIRLTLLDQVKELFGQKVLADTIYAGAGDGEVNTGTDQGSWAANRAKSSGTAVDTSALIMSTCISGMLGDSYVIDRTFLPFDTSPILASATLNSATLYIYVRFQYDDDNDGNDFIRVVQTSQGSAAALVDDDYDQAGVLDNPTAGATDTDFTGLAINAYKSIALNATGLTWIKKNGEASTCGLGTGTTGVTCLGLREGHDVVGTDPVACPGGIAEYDSGITIASSEFSTDKDPYLEVNYTSLTNKITINGGKIKINGGTMKIN